MRVPYGVGVVVDLPLLSQADTKLFKTGATIAAGDAKIRNDNLALATLSAKSRSFTSGGTYVVKPGDTVTGHTSNATALVIGVRLTSGTWAAGTAAGTLFLEQDTGTFQAEDLDVGANLNVATIAGALSAAGVFVEIDSGVAAVGVTSASLTCRQAALILRDAAGAEWCDTAMTFETEGHENAFDPQGCILTDAVGTATGQTTTNIRLSGQPTNAPARGNFFRVVGGTGLYQCGYVKDYLTVGGHYDLTPYEALDTALDATSIIKVYQDAKSAPSRMVGSEPAATPSALPVLGTSQAPELLNWIALRLGLGKRTFNKSTGVETQRNVADNASLGTATHADDGTTVTRAKMS